MIEKIQLINIATHENSIIQFKPGTNSLVGDNGAGKSTVLKMIGYTLFDYLPGKRQKDYVRIGAPNNYGEVNLWFLARDGEEYKIHRTIGKKNNDLSITHTQTGLKLKEINSINSFHEWIHKMLEIRPDLPLKTIFENGIGVHQGTFTEPFLRNPSGRAEVFAPLLNVEIYSRIFKNFRSTLNDLQDDIHSHEKQQSSLEGELTLKPELITKKENYTKELAKISKDLTQLKKEEEKYSEKFQNLEKLNQEIIQIQKEMEVQKEKIDGFQRIYKEHQKNFQDAKKAEKICNENRQAFENYNQLEKKLKEIGEKIRKWRHEKDLLMEEEKTHETLKVSLKQLNSEISKIEELKKELPKLEESNKKFQELAKKEEELKIKLDRIRENENRIKKLEAELSKYKEISLKLKETSINYDRITKKLEELKKFEEDDRKIQIEIQTRKNQVKELEKNINLAKNGTCPLCDQPYHNPDKDLASYFKEKIKSHQDKILELNKKLEIIQKELLIITELEKKKEQISKSSAKYHEQIAQMDEKRKELDDLKQKIDQKSHLLGELKKITEKQTPLKQDSERFSFILERQKALTDLQAQAYQKIQKITEIEVKIKKLNKQVNQGNNLENEQTEMQKSLDNLRPAFEMYQKNQNLASQLPEIHQKISQTKKNLVDSQNRLKSLQERSNQLFKDFNQKLYDEIKAKLNKIKEMLIEKETNQKHLKQDLEDIDKKLVQLQEKEVQLANITQNLKHLEEIKTFCEHLRMWYKEAGPKITEALISRINQTATAIFCQIKNSNNYLIEWQKDYDVIVRSQSIPERNFSQLSGGEQMAVALAIRLSILKILTQIDFAFFDEPTTNLDEETRKNLAQSIQNIHGFDQIFVISHDDTFEEYTDHVIRFSKNENEITSIE